jgi:hypothetical protein
MNRLQQMKLNVKKVDLTIVCQIISVDLVVYCPIGTTKLQLIEPSRQIYFPQQIERRKEAPIRTPPVVIKPIRPDPVPMPLAVQTGLFDATPAENVQHVPIGLLWRDAKLYIAVTVNPDPQTNTMLVIFTQSNGEKLIFKENIVQSLRELRDVGLKHARSRSIKKGLVWSWLQKHYPI